MRRGIRVKLTTAGFSLVEMLAALLVLSLMTGLVASGIAVGTRTYQQERFESQAQVLAGTINSTLADPIRFMQKTGGLCTVTYEGNDISFAEGGSPLHVDGEGHVYLQGSAAGSKQVKLLNDGIYGSCKVEGLVSELKVETGAGGGAKYLFTGSYTISGEDNRSKDFTFAIVPLFGVGRDNAAASGAGGSGSGGSGGGDASQADKSALESQINAAKQELAAGSGKPESAKTAFQNAINAAEEVFGNADATQDEVDAQVANLVAARAAFSNAAGTAPNYGTLKTLIDRVAALGSLRRDDQNLVNALNSAYQAAANMYNDKSATKQSEIDAAATALQNALDAYNNGRYTGDLRSAISSAEAALQTDRVDANGVKAWLDRALANARTAANDPTGHSQSQIDNCTSDLKDATAAYNALPKQSSGGGGGDAVPPVIGAPASDEDLAMSDYGASWTSSSWTWTSLKTSDEPAVEVLALENNGGKQVRLVYYNGVYYKVVSSDQSDSFYAWDTWSPVYVRYLTDNSYHADAWGGQKKWVAL